MRREERSRAAAYLDRWLLADKVYDSKQIVSCHFTLRGDGISGGKGGLESLVPSRSERQRRSGIASTFVRQVGCILLIARRHKVEDPHSG